MKEIKKENCYFIDINNKADYEIIKFTMICKILFPIEGIGELQEFYLAITRSVKSEIIQHSKAELDILIKREETSSLAYMNRVFIKCYKFLKIDRKGEIFNIDSKRLNEIQLIDLSNNDIELYKPLGERIL